MICKYVIFIDAKHYAGSDYLREIPLKQNGLYINHVAICIKFTKSTEVYLDETKEKSENLVMNLAILISN